MGKKVNIMDVTMRDGSYANNFQFSLAQQKEITKGLENSGIEYIEIGHGMGVGASSPKNGVALHSDEEYLLMAQNTLKRAKYGVFCIPGIATIEDVKKAAKYGCSFIRIGTNVTGVDLSQDYIECAKNCGLTVMANYMKSYSVAPSFLAQQAKKSSTYGADYVYVVDSAGCMLPNELEDYYKAIKECVDIKIGFHGHDNLGLAMSNALKAVEIGYDLVDCTLQGMGRSSGNTPTELFSIVTKKFGYEMEYDTNELLLLGKKYIYPMIHRYNSIDTMCGIVGMHTGYLGAIHKVAGKYGVNPLQLMDEYTKYSKIEMDHGKLEEIAQKLPEDIESYLVADFNGYFGNGQF